MKAKRLPARVSVSTEAVAPVVLPPRATHLEVAVHRGVAEVTLHSPAELAPLALDTWAVGLTEAEDEIRIGDAVLDVGVARDLWTRLGEVLGEAERNQDVSGWKGLAAWLDTVFQGATPAIGTDRRGTRVRGLLRRDDDRTALFRVTTYAFALLHPRRGHPDQWEGPVLRHWPGSLVAQAQLTRRRVRVAADQVDRAPRIDPELGRIVRPTRMLGEKRP